VTLGVACTPRVEPAQSPGARGKEPAARSESNTEPKQAETALASPRGTIQLKRQGLEIANPGPDWVVAEGEWFEAKAPKYASTLRLSTFAVPRSATRASCLEQAALVSHGLDVIPDETVVERRRLLLPEAFDTELVVQVTAERDAVVGRVVLYGKSVSACLVAIFSTQALGPSATRLVAHRLQWAVDYWLPTLRRPAIGERLPRAISK
jgi:hypothetical protein